MSAETEREAHDRELVHMTLHDFEVQLRQAYKEGRYDGHSLGEAESLEWDTRDWQRSNTSARLAAVRKSTPLPGTQAVNLTLADGSVWPHPDQCEKVADRIEAGTWTIADLATATAALRVYDEVCNFPDMMKNLPRLRRALRHWYAKQAQA